MKSKNDKSYELVLKNTSEGKRVLFTTYIGEVS